MRPQPVGYEFLRTHLATGAFEPNRVAVVAPVTKVVASGDRLQVPAQVAPSTDDPLAHLLFALKHEGLDLQAAILALKHIPASPVATAFAHSPGSAYLRQIGYLWELAHGQQLPDTPAAQGGYVALFDPAQFVTGPSRRSSRWRVDFNGIGDPHYCPSVRRTPALQAWLDKHILGAAQSFVANLDPAVLDRAVRWAYLSETEGSYDIERESPQPSKAQAFATLLARAHEPQPMTEDYLVDLQNLAVTNPLDRAYEFRHAQNWLRGPSRGALGVTYVPPPPDALPAIMDSIMALANSAGSTPVDPLVLGALVSFAFVFAHPFMDGNGRLSRFLFHRVVGASAALPNGLVLPVSVAMKRHETQYLQALQTFSRPAREAWSVQWIDGDRFDLAFQGPPEIYRYWDATACVEFSLHMAHEALEKDLREESDYLLRFDRLYRALNEAIDMNNNDLTLLVQSALQHGGVLSKNRIKQLHAKGHPLALLAQAQQVITQSLAQPDSLKESDL